MNKNKIKKGLLCLGVFLLCIASFKDGIVLANTKANQVIKVDEYELKKADKSEITEEDYIKFADQLKIGFSYTIEEGTVLSSDIEYEVPLPNNLVWPQTLQDKDIPITLTYKDENAQDVHAKLADMYVSSNRAYLKYDANINTHLAKLGTVLVHVKDLDINAQLDRNSIQDAQQAVIDLGNGKQVVINVDDNRIVQPTIEDKEASYKEGIITWKVTIKPGNRTFADYQLKDVLGSNQTYVENSFKVNDVLQTPEQTPTLENGSTLLYTFASLDASTTQVITYQSIVDTNLFFKDTQLQNVNTDLTNKASLVDNKGAVLSSKEAKHTLNETWLTKTGKEVIEQDGSKSILWTLKINGVKQKGLTIRVYDVIQNTKYVTRPTALESLKINGIAVPSLPTVTQGFVYADGEQAGDYSANGITFEIGNVDGDCVVEYKTPISSSYFEENNTSVKFENEAWLEVDWDPMGTGQESTFTLPTVEKGKADVKTSLITKSIKTDYDPKTQEIVWEVKVNSNQIDMKEAVVKDVIPTGQKYVSDSLKDDNSVQKDYSDSQNPIYNFGNIGTSIKTFTITTKVIDSTFIASNSKKNFHNEVVLEYKYGTNTTPMKASSKPSKTFASNVLKKEKVSYDYEKKEQTWKIIVNTNEMKLEDVTIQDVLSEEQTLKEGSILVDGQPLTKDTSKGSYYSIDENNELRIHLQDDVQENAITKKYEIEFVTSVDINKITDIQSKGNVSIVNSAALHMKDFPTVSGVSATQSIQNTLISKKADTSSTANGIIKYHVEINQNGALLKNIKTVKDTMSKGVCLDLDSIILYYGNTNKNGSISKGSLVPPSEYTYSYTAMDTNNILNVTFKNDIDKIYVLEYTADIAGSGTLSNAIALEGQSGDLSSNVNVSISGTASAEAAMKRKGKVNVTLYQTGTTTPLGNCEFFLVQDGNVVQKATTDSNGKISFSLLNLNKPYQIVQNTTKDGYAKETEKITFTPTSTIAEDKVVYNDTNKGSVQFVVKDKDENAIKDTVFEIFEANDTTFSNPIKKAISDENGNVIFPNVLFGKYIVKQKESVVGFVKDPNVYYATIENDGLFDGLKTKTGDFVCYVENAYSDEYGSLKIVLKDTAGNPIKGAIFEILNEKGVRIEEVSSDQNGCVVLPFLLKGAYSVRQLTSVDEYVKEDTLFVTTIQPNQESVVEVVNHKKKAIEPPEIKEPPKNGKPPETKDTSSNNLYTTSLWISFIALCIGLKKRNQI